MGTIIHQDYYKHEDVYFIQLMVAHDVDVPLTKTSMTYDIYNMGVDDFLPTYCDPDELRDELEEVSEKLQVRT